MVIDELMKDWLLDCFTEQQDHEEIEELTHDELVNAINRYYDGGMKEFVRCLGWDFVHCLGWDEVNV